MSVSYRIRQFRAAIRATVTPAEYAMVARILPPAEYHLFQQMPLYDQRHCLDVYYTLVAAGEQDPLLLRAALFHDCGKVSDDGRPLALGWYVIATILKRWPALYLFAARLAPPIAIYAEHAARGARMAAPVVRRRLSRRSGTITIHTQPVVLPACSGPIINTDTHRIVCRMR